MTAEQAQRITVRYLDLLGVRPGDLDGAGRLLQAASEDRRRNGLRRAAQRISSL